VVLLLLLHRVEVDAAAAGQLHQPDAPALFEVSAQPGQVLVRRLGFVRVQREELQAHSRRHIRRALAVEFDLTELLRERERDGVLRRDFFAVDVLVFVLDLVPLIQVERALRHAAVAAVTRSAQRGAP
jgi:hypothetical protein